MIPAAPLDTQYTAETPEGIALALRPAGAVSRCHAFLIDLALRLVLLIIASMVLGMLGRFGGGLLLLIMFLIEWFYPVVFELGMNGATPGKRSLGLRVLMDSGLPVTPAASLLRNLLRTADFLPFGYALGFLCMLLRADFRRLGDLAAGTLVVYAHAPSLSGPLAPATPAAPARVLTPREQAAVLAWAGRATRITPARLEELALMAEPAFHDAGDSRRPDPSERLMSIAQWLWGRR